MNKTTLTVLAVSLFGCGADESSGRNSARVSEIEVTHQSGSTTSIERIELRYSGSELSEVNAYLNGAPNGTARATYDAGRIGRIDYADKEGDRAFSKFTYANNLLSKERYEVTGAVTQERNLSYDAQTGELKEQSYTRTLGNAAPHNWLARYEYDELVRLSKVTTLDGMQSMSTEIRYDDAGLVERNSVYFGTTHDETYDFRYLQDGRLDEILDTHNGRYGLTYNSDNLIAEVRYSSGSATETYRYTYGDGSISGLSFAPAIPLAELFDLGGKGYDTLSLSHIGAPLAGNIEHVSDTGGGGGSGGGGGGGGGGSGSTCSLWASDGSACQECLAAACCSEYGACLDGSQCSSFYDCGTACNGDSTCIQGCQSQYPQGAADYQTAVSCQESSCTSSCQ